MLCAVVFGLPVETITTGIPNSRFDRELASEDLTAWRNCKMSKVKSVMVIGGIVAITVSALVPIVVYPKLYPERYSK